MFMILILFSCFNSNDKNNLAKEEIAITKFSQSDSVTSYQLSINGLKIGDFKEKLLKYFGNPSQIEEGDNEFQNSKFVDLVYGNSNFTLENDKLVSFEINDKSFILDVLNIHIGQQTEELRAIFPNSYRNAENINGVFTINIFVKDLDQHLVFSFVDGKLIGFLLTGTE